MPHRFRFSVNLKKFVILHDQHTVSILALVRPGIELELLTCTVVFRFIFYSFNTISTNLNRLETKSFVANRLWRFLFNSNRSDHIILFVFSDPILANFTTVTTGICTIVIFVNCTCFNYLYPVRLKSSQFTRKILNVQYTLGWKKDRSN